MKRNIKVLVGSAVFLAAVVVVLLRHLDLRKEMLKQAFPTDYFEAEAALPDLFESINQNVYSFRKGMSRGLIIDTEQGLAVFDTFSTTYAMALKAALSRRFPGKRVRWVFYSHNHLDHIRGAAALEPEEIIGHRDINGLLDDWPQASDIARVTRPIEGDVDLALGATKVRLLYMPRSHSTTLYAFYVPAARVVFAPDLLFRETVPPFGLPDWYYPGYVRALDRLIALDAKDYVPTHFARGNLADLVRYRSFIVDFHTAVSKAVLARGRSPIDSGEQARRMMDEAYTELEPKYGRWHGFYSMFVPQFGREIGGTYLGY